MPAYTVKEIGSIASTVRIAYACLYCQEVSTASTVLILVLLHCLYCYAMLTLVLMPAYTVKEVSTASTVLIL